LITLSPYDAINTPAPLMPLFSSIDAAIFAIATLNIDSFRHCHFFRHYFQIIFFAIDDAIRLPLMPLDAIDIIADTLADIAMI
jgi:hypothetical protein